MKNIAFAVVGMMLVTVPLKAARAATFECHYELNLICGNQGGSSSRVSKQSAVLECATVAVAEVQIQQKSTTDEGDCMTFASQIECVQH